MPVPSSALEHAYARLAEVLPGLDITQLATAAALPRHGGWVTADALAEGGTGLDAFLAWDDAQVLRDYGQSARPDVVASFGLHRYAWPACLLPDDRRDLAQCPDGLRAARERCPPALHEDAMRDGTSHAGDRSALSPSALRSGVASVLADGCSQAGQGGVFRI